MKIKFSSITDTLGYSVPAAVCVDEVIFYAIENKYTCLVANEDEYKLLQTLAFHYGMWDWDGENILGVKIIKEDETK